MGEYRHLLKKCSYPRNFSPDSSFCTKTGVGNQPLDRSASSENIHRLGKSIPVIGDTKSHADRTYTRTKRQSFLCSFSNGQSSWPSTLAAVPHNIHIIGSPVDVQVICLPLDEAVGGNLDKGLAARVNARQRSIGHC